MSPTRDVSQPTTTSRRIFLQRLAAVGALGAGGYAASRSIGSSNGLPGSLRPGADGFRPGSTASPAAAADPAAAGRRVPGAIDDRILVIVDLQGGNDGLSTLVPAGDGRYYDLRPDLGVPDDEVLALGDDVGLHPSLSRLHKRGVTTVEGVGPIDGDLSHFAMTERWQRGDADGTNAYRTGFFGRLLDTIDDGSPLVGVSLAGTSPYLLSEHAAALSLDGMNTLDTFYPHEWGDSQAWLAGIEAFASAPAVGRSDLGSQINTAYRELLDLGPKVTSNDDDVDWDDPLLAEGGDLGSQMYLASRLLDADVGVRIIYAALGGFDTHQDHFYTQASNLEQVDIAIDGFLRLSEDAGRGDKVVVATVSEFGRRVGENGSGLDHGTASTMLLAGPLENRRLGERPDLTNLDDDGNMAVTVGFDRYLASLAEEWLGVEAASVLANDPEPLGLL